MQARVADARALRGGAMGLVRPQLAMERFEPAPGPVRCRMAHEDFKSTEDLEAENVLQPANLGLGVLGIHAQNIDKQAGQAVIPSPNCLCGAHPRGRDFDSSIGLVAH